jgi:hypothetical protein
MAIQKNNISYKVFIVEDNKLYAQVLKKQLIDTRLRFFIMDETALPNLMINPM